MIVTSAALVILAALLFGVAVAGGSLGPLYGSITASVAALLVISLAALRYHLRHDRAP